jgi:hypothetical protein
MGGWRTGAGTRLLVFITPTMVDPAGNRLPPPYRGTSQIVLETKFASGPDQDFADPKLQTLFTEQNESKEGLQCSDAESRSYIQAIFRNKGANLLACPRVLTLLGRQAQVAMQDTEMIAGNNQQIGPSVDFLPTLSADGKSVDLVVIARYSMAAPKASQ